MYGNTPLETIEADFKASAEAWAKHGFNVNGIMVQGKGGSELDHYSEAARARVEPITSKYFYYSDRYGVSTQYNNKRNRIAAGWSSTKSLIDNAISNKSFTILATHGYDEVTGMATYTHDYLIKLLDYLKEKEDAGELEVVTYRDLFKRFADWETPVDLGDTKHTVDFYAEDGKTFIGSSVAIAGQAATPPVFDMADGYTLKGWTGNITKVTKNMKVSAVTHKYDSSAGGSSGIIIHTHKWSSYQSDKTGHWRVCTVKACGEKEQISAHSPSASATEQAAQVCTVCGYEIAPKLVHEHLYGEWLTDASGHYRTCKTCGKDSPIEKHVTGGAATENTDEVCTVCDYVITPSLGHVHKLTKIEAKPATCVQDGNIEYYRCTCGRRFKDAAGKTEITRHIDILLRADGKHADGNDDEKCDVCGKKTSTTPQSSEPESSEPTISTPDSAVPESSAPVDVPADVSDVEQQPADKMGALPFIILGTCAAIAVAAVTGVLIWSKKKIPPTKDE